MAWHAALPAQQSPPDAIVLVQPMGVDSMVVVTYSSRKAREQVRQAVTRLADLAGGTVTQLTVSDVPVEGQGRSAAGNHVQTSAEAVLRDATFLRQDAFVLQPFLDAMRGMERFDVLFMVPRIEGFRGLSNYESGGVRLQLTQDGNPYRYALTISPNVTEVPQLPLYQPVNPSKETPRPNSRQSSRAVMLVLLTALAAATGSIVFVLLRRAAIRRSGA